MATDRIIKNGKKPFRFEYCERCKNCKTVVQFSVFQKRKMSTVHQQCFASISNINIHL